MAQVILKREGLEAEGSCDPSFQSRDVAPGAHSHSIVPGGFDVMS